MAAAKALAGAAVDIILIDKRNHHLFQPLLYQVATAGLSPADIAGSNRAILGRQSNVCALLDRVYGIDRVQLKVILGDGVPIAYDWLINATGATHSYFGNDAWASFAPGIKTIGDAAAIRGRVLLALERAETETDLERRNALLTFLAPDLPATRELVPALTRMARSAYTLSV